MKSNNNNMATPTAAATPPPPSSSSTTTSTPSTPTAEDQQLLMERYHRRLAIEYMMLQACCDGHTATVLELLASSDAADAIRVTNHAGQTPLHIAAAYGHMALVEMLVYRGHAVLDAVDAYDKTPMQLAAAHGHREVADFIAQQLERQRLHQLQQSPTTLAAASPTAASPAAASPAAAPPPPSDARQRLEQWLGPPVEFADDLERHGDAFAPGARSFYTEAVLAWLKMTNVTSNVLWLNAGSGFGKSAIAWHLSQTLPLAAPRWESAAGGDSWSLGATFFCSRSDTVRRDPFAFVATVVLDLCSAFPSFERHCLSVMAQDQLFQRIRSSNSDDSSTPTTTSSSTSSLLDDPEAAFQRLVVDGLRQVGPEERVPVVLIIDALDELGPPTGAYRNEAIPPDAADPELESKRVFLGLLSRLLPQLPAPWVRVFVTGRPERDVHYAMEKASAMRLPHVESTDAGDIDALSTAIVGRSSVLQWPSPPSADTVQTVARKALLYQSCSPLYTRLAWMHLEHFDGVQKREQVVQSLGAGVDGLYRQMLAHRFDSDSQYNNFRLVLMLIVAVREPMTQDELAHLLGTPSFVVGQILAQLGGLVNRVDQGRIKLIHYTLADHLTSPERCQNRQFFISRSEGSHRVLSACIKAMMSRAGDLSISEKAALLSRSGQRRWSVSRLVEDGANAADTTDPESRVLSYGARYWLWHLRDAIVDGSLRLILGLDDAEPTTFTLPPGKPLDDPHSLASQWVLFCARDAFGPAALLLGWETRSPTLIAAVLDGVRDAAIAGRVADAGEAIRGLFVDVAAVASPCFSPMRSLPAAAAPSSDAACKRSGAKARKVVNDDPEALYEFSERVGASGVGKVEVFKARAKKTGRPVSIKIVELDEDEDQTLLIDEVTRLRGMSNVNILSYNCHSAKTLMGTGSVWIVTESCGGSSLESAILDSQNLLQEHEIAAVLREVIKGLCFLHRLKRNHGNIKPGNIFLTDSGEVKLADLWLPISMLSPLRLAPEEILAGLKNLKADIWALGIIALELFEGRGLRTAPRPVDVSSNYANLPAFKNLRSDEFNDFLQKCLRKDPSLRPTAKDLLKHPFVRQRPRSAELIKQLLVRSRLPPGTLRAHDDDAVDGGGGGEKDSRRRVPEKYLSAYHYAEPPFAAAAAAAASVGGGPTGLHTAAAAGLASLLRDTVVRWVVNPATPPSPVGKRANNDNNNNNNKNNSRRQSVGAVTGGRERLRRVCAVGVAALRRLSVAAVFMLLFAVVFWRMRTGT